MKKFAMFVILAFTGLVNANLIQNGSFENGADQWYTGGGTIIDTDSADGGYCASLFAEVSDTNLDWRSAGISVLPGEELTLSFSYKTIDVAYNNSTQVRFRFFGDNWLGEAQSDLAATGGLWQDVSLTYTAPENSVFCDVWFTLNTFGDKSTGTALFDSVVVTPEPATIMLLTLGGIGALKRRR